MAYGSAVGAHGDDVGWMLRFCLVLSCLLVFSLSPPVSFPFPSPPLFSHTTLSLSTSKSWPCPRTVSTTHTHKNLPTARFNRLVVVIQLAEPPGPSFCRLEITRLPVQSGYGLRRLFLDGAGAAIMQESSSKPLDSHCCSWRGRASIGSEGLSKTGA